MGYLVQGYRAPDVVAREDWLPDLAGALLIANVWLQNLPDLVAVEVRTLPSRVLFARFRRPGGDDAPD